jgi:hypothetical protein
MSTLIALLMKNAAILDYNKSVAIMGKICDRGAMIIL